MIIKITKTNQKDDYASFSDSEFGEEKAICFMLDCLDNDVTAHDNVFYDQNRNKETKYSSNDELLELIFADQYGDYQFFKLEPEELEIDELLNIAKIVSAGASQPVIKEELINIIDSFSGLSGGR